MGAVVRLSQKNILSSRMEWAFAKTTVKSVKGCTVAMRRRLRLSDIARERGTRERAEKEGEGWEKSVG